ncbi:MAG: dihydrofolate reductase [Alphaproteobacteria bacterium]
MSSDTDHRPKPKLSLIAAVARNGVIGVGGNIPWRISSDMKRFKRITLGKPVIMGRKTAESIGPPLVDRTNIVLSRQDLVMPGFIKVTSIDEAMDVATDALAALGGDEIIVAGGGEVYSATIEAADRLYMTHVETALEGDAHFPRIDDRWQKISQDSFPAGERDSHATIFTVYQRLPAPQA